MNRILSGLAAALFAISPLAGPAFATTTHWGDTVTYVKVGGAVPNCIKFQTTATGGVFGVENTSTGNTGATGWTGNAQWNDVGVATTSGNNTKQYSSGAIWSLLENSYLTGGQIKLDWVDEGTNTATYYPDCPTTEHAADNLGQ